MTTLGVDPEALARAAARIQATAAEFSQGRSQVSRLPRAHGGTWTATDLLDHVLMALETALGRAGEDLTQVSGHLSAAASQYAALERALSAWRVPGPAGGGS